MSYIGSYKIDDLLTFVANTQVFATGAATDADSPPAYRVYEDETGTAILTGTMALLDSSNTNGFYSEQITLSAANGFEKGKCYSIYISATVSSVAGATHRTFQMQAEVAVASINSGAITAASIASDAITDAKVASDVTIASVTGAVGSVTGAVGSVTGNVGGNVTGSVGSVAAGGITASSIAADAITAAKIADGAIDANTFASGALDAVWSTTTRQLTGTQTFNLTGNITGNLSGSVGSVTGAVGSVTGSVGSVATGGITTASFAAGAINAAAIGTNAIDADALAADAVTEITAGIAVPTAIQNADALLDRDMSTGTDSGSSTVRTPRQALRFLRNKWSLSGTTLTVTKEDDSTSSWTSVVTTSAGADPITANDPAGP